MPHRLIAVNKRYSNPSDPDTNRSLHPAGAYTIWYGSFKCCDFHYLGVLLFKIEL